MINASAFIFLRSDDIHARGVWFFFYKVIGASEVLTWHHICGAYSDFLNYLASRASYRLCSLVNKYNTVTLPAGCKRAAINPIFFFNLPPIFNSSLLAENAYRS